MSRITLPLLTAVLALSAACASPATMGSLSAYGPEDTASSSEDDDSSPQYDSWGDDPGTQNATGGPVAPNAVYGTVTETWDFYADYAGYTNCSTTYDVVRIPTAPLSSCPDCDVTMVMDWQSWSNSCEFESQDWVGVRMGIMMDEGYGVIEQDDGTWGVLAEGVAYGTANDGAYQGSSDWLQVEYGADIRIVVDLEWY